MTAPSSTDQNRSQPRDRLIDTAITLLHGNGYRAVGVQALCEEAGVRKGSFYHFFASKEELTLEALNHAWDIFRSTVVEPTLGADVDDVTRARRIREACIAPVLTDHDSTIPHGCLFGRLAASIGETEPLLRSRLGEIFTEWAYLLGGGDDGWGALADIQGRLVLAFTVENPEVIGA